MPKQIVIAGQNKQNLSKTNEPVFLEDVPIDDEEQSSFEIHNRIAKAMYEEIEISNPSGLALIGKWGSGKSTVLNLLEKNLASSKNNYSFFLFDTWAHADDSLRKAFLLSLGNLLLDNKLIGVDAWNEKKGRIEGTQKLETTIQQSEFSPFTAFIITFAFSYAAALGIMSGLHLIPGFALAEYLVPFLSGAIALLLSTCVAGNLYLKKKKATKAEDPNNKGAKKQTFGNRIHEFLSYLTGRPAMTSSSEVNTLAELDTIEFQKEFKSLLQSARSNKETRLVIAIDNLDRLAPEDIKKAWDTIQIFSGFSFDLDIKPWIILPYSPDLSSLSRSAANTNDAQGAFSKLFIKQFELPEPITTDWKNCFTEYLSSAFPGISLEVNLKLFSIVNTLDFGCIDKTPREAIRFINEMVSQKKIFSEISLTSIAIFCGIKTKHRMEDPSQSFVSFLMPFLSGEKDWVDRQIANLHCIKKDCLNELSMMAFGVFSREAADEAYVKFSIENAVNSEESISFGAMMLDRSGTWSIAYDCLCSILHSLESNCPWIAQTLLNLDSYEPKNAEESHWKNQILQLLVSNLDLCHWPPYIDCGNTVVTIIESPTFNRDDANNLYSHILKSISSHIKDIIVDYNDKDYAQLTAWLAESSKVFFALDEKGFLPEKIELANFGKSYGILAKAANQLDKDVSWLSRTTESSPDAFYSALTTIVDLIESDGPLDVNWNAMSFLPALTLPVDDADNFGVKAFYAPKDAEGQIDQNVTNSSLFSFEGSSSSFSYFIAAWSMLRFGKINSERAEVFIKSIEIPEIQHASFLEYLLNDAMVWQPLVIDLVLEAEEAPWSTTLLTVLESSKDEFDLGDIGGMTP